MKKVIFILLLLISTLSLVSCGSTSTDSNNSNNTSTEIQERTDRNIISEMSRMVVGLKSYFDDEGHYPIIDKLTPTSFENFPKMDLYLNEMPKEAYYMSLKFKTNENSGVILAAELDGDNRSNCNIAVSSMDDLQKTIEENGNQVLELIKLINKNGVQEGPCFYIILEL